MSEKDLESKQLFLRQEIIDQGYDPSDFNTYMCSIRQEENIDLNNWTFDEIKEVITNYKELLSQKENEENKENIIDNNNDNINNNDNTNNNENNNDNNNDNVNNGELGRITERHTSSLINPKTEEPFDNYQKIGNCKKLEPNELTERDDLRVIVSDAIKINPGFFSISYYQYKVTTNPLNYSVTRKLSDFLFLNQKLPLIHPVIYTPLFPVFHYGVKDDSPKKIRYIQNYMNLILENKYFRSLPIVYDFITLPLEEWNKKMKDNYSKIKEAPGFDNMPNLEGKYMIKISKEDENKASSIKNEINTKLEGLKNLNYYLDELLTNYDKMSLTLKNIGVCFYEMEKAEKNLQKNNILIKGYNDLGNLFKTWSNDYLAQKDFIKNEIKYYFKFISKEYKNFLNIYEAYKGARDEYKKDFDKVKKMKAPTDNDLNMLKGIQKYYGFELTCINDEYKNLEERMEKRLINQFMVFDKNKDIIFQDFNNCIKLINFGKNNNDLDENNNTNEENNINNDINEEDKNNINEIENNE